MSSEPASQGIYLIVKYYGAKAVQHFSKEFSPLSSSIFRQDLSTMKFPHPKVINTRLTRNATVVALWPDASHKTHDVLYNHLKKNTNAASSNGLLGQLSILLLSVVEIEAEGKKPIQLAFTTQGNVQLSSPHGLPPPAKRPRLDDTSHSSVPIPQPHLRSLPSALPATNPSYAPRSSISVSQSHPVPPRLAPQGATGITSTSQKRSWDGQIVPLTLPSKPLLTSSFPLRPQTRVLSSTPLPRGDVSAPPAPIQAMHNLPSRPSSGLVPPSQDMAALNVQGTCATQPPSNALDTLTTRLAAPTAGRAPISPVQALGHETIQNRQLAQSCPARTPTPAVTQPQPLHRTQVSSPTQPRSLTAPAPPNGAAGTSTQVTHDNRLKPFPALAPSTVNAVTPPLAVRGALKTRSASNTPGVSAVQAVGPAATTAARPMASSGQALQVAPQQQQNHQPTHVSQAPTPTPVVPKTQLLAPQGQRESTCPPSSNPGSDGSELETLRKRVKSMEEMLRKQLNVKVRLDETANKLAEEQEVRKKLEETAAAARESEANAKRRLVDVQKLFEEEGRRRSERDDLLAAARQDALSYLEMHDQAKRERDEFALGYDRLQDELSFSHRNADAAQDELDRALQSRMQMERELQEETDRRRQYQDQLASAESNEAALQQRCDEVTQEVASLMRMRNRDEQDSMATKRRDAKALLRYEEKLRTQQILMQQAEDTMRAAQSGEKALRRRLEEVESRLEEVQSGLEAELEAERRLRREAEDAISDIRRECREPFVVPSLLDAFVELARMTTAATISDGLATRTDQGNLENKNPRDDSLPMDNAQNVVSSDTGTTAASAEWTHEQESLFSPHYSPRSPQHNLLSPQCNSHSPQLKVTTPQDVVVHAGFPETQIKLESEQRSPTWS